MNTSPEWLFLTEKIFHEAVETPEPERTELLEARCGGDATLMLELRSLLEACEAEERHGVAATSVHAAEPWRVGPYEIDRILGRGGMGAVYLAHRADGQFEQQVAIKVIDLPLATALFRERFRTERQILAGLSHPCIARLLDGGVSEDGEPYLAMEYIDGVSITRFCEAGSLGVRARLQLFRRVCEAVQYAHQNLIVHRDLKPDNILVTEDGSPRLLDFGTAKILTPVTAQGGSDPTRMQAFTPRYASPEQVLGKPITIASDIYSLGVLLYLLLTESQPYELNEFTTEEMVRVVCGQEPRRPSDTESAVGKLDADVDCIVLKALRKEPGERYATVDHFASDVQAYLDRRPVQARRGNLRYRAGKFARRNKLAIAAASLLTLSVAGGIAGVLWQSRVANVQRRKAEARSEDLRQLSNSLLSELDEAIKELPGSTSAQKLLVTRVLEHLDRMSADSPDDQLVQLDLADAYTRIGNLQGNPYDQNIGDARGGLASIDKAVGTVERFKTIRPQDAAVLHAYGLAQQSRGEVLYGMGRAAEAVVSMRLASATFGELASTPAATPLQMSEAATAYGGMADVMGQSGNGSLGDTQGALVAYRQALMYQQRALKVDPNFARARRNLPISMMKVGNMELDTDPWQAVHDYRQSLQAMERYPEDQKSGLAYRRTYATINRRLAQGLTEIEDYAAAIRILEESRTTLEGFAKADPQDARARIDLTATLENEALCHEYLAEPAFQAAQQDRAQHRHQALLLLEEAAVHAEALLQRNPGDLSTRGELANFQVRVAALQQQSPRGRRKQEALARQGLTTLRQIAESPAATSFVLEEVSTSLLTAEPPWLRDPGATVEYARRAVAINPHQPLYRLTLAQAYRAAGDAEQARQTAAAGLAMLAPVRAGETSTRMRRLLDIEMK